MGPLLGGFAPFKFTSSNANVVITGHSISASLGSGTSGIAALAPINGQISTINHTSNGATVATLVSQAPSTVDIDYVAGKKNILVFYGATNSLFTSGEDATTVFNEVKAYCQARLAVNPGWKIVIVTEIPRIENLSQGVIDYKNSQIEAYNTLVRSSFRSCGAAAVADTRVAGSVFNIPDYTLASFDATGLYDPQATNYRVHLLSGGAAALCALVAPALKKLPR